MTLRRDLVCSQLYHHLPRMHVVIYDLFMAHLRLQLTAQDICLETSAATEMVDTDYTFARHRNKGTTWLRN